MVTETIFSTRLEENPALLDFAQTIFGKQWLLIIFSFLLMFMSYFLRFPCWMFIAFFLIPLTYFPARRNLIIFIATFVVLIANPDFHIPFSALLIALTFFISFVCVSYLCQIKHVVTIWMLCVFALMAAATYLKLPHYAVVVVIAIINYFWFMAYSLQHFATRKFSAVLSDIKYYHPFWGSYFIPFPKGANYIEKIACKNPEELAVCQIKAIKLLSWGLLLATILVLLHDLQKTFHIPSLVEAFKDYQAGNIYSRGKAWDCLLMQFANNVLLMTVWGHLVIAIVRMSGFNTLRNTYKPFLSTTIAEFWNRYYFYFKELLVEFFFYPTYFRFFKSHPKVRILFATFMAAGVGNVIYHYFFLWQYPIKLGMWHALENMQAYLFYCVVLSLGIACSQIFNQRKEMSRLQIIFGWLRVNSFYVIMTIFNDPYTTKSILINFLFLRSLF